MGADEGWLHAFHPRSRAGSGEREEGRGVPFDFGLPGGRTCGPWPLVRRHLDSHALDLDLTLDRFALSAIRG